VSQPSRQPPVSRVRGRGDVRQVGSIGSDRSRTRVPLHDGDRARLELLLDRRQGVEDRRQSTLDAVADASEQEHARDRLAGEGEQRREVGVRGDEDAVLGGRALQHLGIWCSGETDPDDVGRVVAGLGEVVGQSVLDRLVEQEPHAVWSSAIVR
jgi:hypothetical protein